jgi:hypothetical protein
VSATRRSSSASAIAGTCACASEVWQFDPESAFGALVLHCIEVVLEAEAPDIAHAFQMADIPVSTVRTIMTLLHAQVVLIHTRTLIKILVHAELCLCKRHQQSMRL